MSRIVAVGLAVVALSGCPGGACDRQTPATSGPEPVSSAGAPAGSRPSAGDVAGWLKGQLHLHTGMSGDSETPPSVVVRWYREHGYDFIVLTDHDHITEVQSSGEMLVLPGVELTQNLRTCDPPPEAGMSCLLHVNALMVRPGQSGPPPWSPVTSDRRIDRFERALATARALGGIAQLNHPNFHYSADAALIEQLAREGLPLMEVANEAVDSNNDGDAEHPSTEALWDTVLTRGVRIWGTATDDAHHYDDAEDVRRRGEVAYTGDRGFVMVRARRDPGAIRAALLAGDFYASNGVLLTDVSVEDGRLRVIVASSGSHDMVFIGSGGNELGRATGRTGEFVLSRLHPGGYVRCVVTDAQHHRAWTQPVFAAP